MDKNDRQAELRALAKGIADAMTVAYQADDQPTIRAVEDRRERLAADARRAGFIMNDQQGIDGERREAGKTEKRG
ncbi:MAG: hypothetical protein ABI876_08575 [Bacteroidota bacterium]